MTILKVVFKVVLVLAVAGLLAAKYGGTSYDWKRELYVLNEKPFEFKGQKRASPTKCIVATYECGFRFIRTIDYSLDDVGDYYSWKGPYLIQFYIKGPTREYDSVKISQLKVYFSRSDRVMDLISRPVYGSLAPAKPDPNSDESAGYEFTFTPGYYIDPHFSGGEELFVEITYRQISTENEKVVEHTAVYKYSPKEETGSTREPWFDLDKILGDLKERLLN